MLYSSEALEACRQVLYDVVHCLLDYQDRFYLVGGWAVYYLLDRPDRSPASIGFAGTEDVDLAFLVPMDELERIIKTLEATGYQRSSSQRMTREVSGRRVILDLLGGSQDIKDAFTVKRRISGMTLSEDAVDAEINIANLPACLVLKVQAFDENPKDKDGYDIYYLITHGGTKDGDAAQEVKRVLEHPFIADGLSLLRIHFGRVEGRGLRSATVALRDLEGRTVQEARTMVRGSFRRFFTELEMPVNF